MAFGLGFQSRNPILVMYCSLLFRVHSTPMISWPSGTGKCHHRPRLGFLVFHISMPFSTDSTRSAAHRRAEVSSPALPLRSCAESSFPLKSPLRATTCFYRTVLDSFWTVLPFLCLFWTFEFWNFVYCNQKRGGAAI